MHLVDDGDQLGTEDSKYLLRTLELEAYGSFVSALRAQGALNEYKQTLLEHVRTTLFISLDRHKSELRRATNDEMLARVAKKLNPCSDTLFSWVHQCSGSKLGQSSPSVGVSVRSLADNLSELAEEHNDSIASCDQTLLELIQLPRAPQVPEALRSFLSKTEDSESKSAIKKLDSTSPKTKLPRQVKQEPNDISRSESAASRADTPQSTVSSEPPTVKIKPSTSGVKKVVASKGKASIKLKTPEFKVRHKTPAKPRAKPSSPGKVSSLSATFTCARVQPFVFPAPAPGSKDKPPRGNPDRRTLKRMPLSAAQMPIGQKLAATGTGVAKVTSFHPGLPVIKKRRSGPTTFFEPLPFAEGNDLTLMANPMNLVRKSDRPCELGNGNNGASPPSSAHVSVNTSPLAMQAAYSNPTRPYYGNPSAAAMGITVKPISESPTPNGGSQKLMVVRRGEESNAPVLSPSRPPPDLGPPLSLVPEVIRGRPYIPLPKPSLMVMRRPEGDQSAPEESAPTQEEQTPVTEIREEVID